MRSGAGMFRCLDNYRNEDYFREHDLVDIHVRENHYLYRVFSAIETKTSGFVYSPDFEDHFHENIETAIRESLVAGGMSPDDFDDDSKVLALSTCMAVNYTENRFVVFLVRENELS